jgi:GNAT superfamily N-acetyltransferase
VSGGLPGASGTGSRPRAVVDITYRPGHERDLDACTRIWRVAIEDYQARLGQPQVPDDPAPLLRLLAHLLKTDPERFWVAERAGRVAGRGPAVGFASASVREGLWFLAMLFVEPASQAAGVGLALMDRAQAGRDVSPGGPAVPGPDDPFDTGIHTWGMCTDAAQPISNALYARRGMPPRIPAWRLFGEVRRWGALPQPPPSLEVASFEAVIADGPEGARRLADVVDGLDREIVGSAHPRDHAWLRREGRTGFLVQDRGDGRALGYAYGSTAGRLGPVAALDPALHPVLLGLAIREAPAFGPVAAWVPGTAVVAMRALLDAGLRFDGFPGLVCWSRAEHPFERYIPSSLALV